MMKKRLEYAEQLLYALKDSKEENIQYATGYRDALKSICEEEENARCDLCSSSDRRHFMRSFNWEFCPKCGLYLEK